MGRESEDHNAAGRDVPPEPGVDDNDTAFETTSVNFRPERRVLDAPIPEKIGPFRVLKELGVGGMGTVFLAEQTAPVRRQVAIKVMRSRFLDREGRVRFQAERQAMARLQHPNIAQIFVTDTTSEGHPYFAMEYVDGERLTRHCDEQRLPVRARLRLFQQVCDGVQHAHQKGILHRDLKPSNILVTEVDGKAMPKIIDFGIAKAIDHPLAEGALVTGDRLIGTPAYLSPEAAQMHDGPIDVDTRSDVYSLGILLYELLVGRRPFDDQGGMLQVLRRIAYDEPAGPSTRWSDLDITTRTELAARRHADPGSFRSELRGDLDWIVLKAIARDRQHRYSSAAELSADIGRHLEHRPVEASPPSTIYRLRKFARRRAGTVFAAFLVLLALAGGLVARTLEANRANRAAASAIKAQEETEAALLMAEQARTEAKDVSDFLVDVFGLSDPGETLGNTVTARELLDTAAAELSFGFEDQPLARARFMHTIATVYRKLGLYDRAETLFREALVIRRQHLHPDHPEIADSLNGLGIVKAKLGRYEEAEPLIYQALAIREASLPADSIDIAMSLNNLANLYTDAGEPERAEPLYVRAAAIVEQHEGPKGADLMVGLNNLATSYLDTDRPAKAEPLLRSFLAYQREEHGDKHPHVAIALGNLALARWHQGDAREAEQLYQESSEILDEVLGRGHPEYAYVLSKLGELCAEEGRREEAETLLRRALVIQEAGLPEDHPERMATVEALSKLPNS